MKKLLPLLFTVYCLLFTSLEVFAYTSVDVDNANFLADQGIINSQSNPANYRLDDTISRVEAMKIALKIKGVEIPANYICKGIFQDSKYEKGKGWVCQVIETAANEGIISKNNTPARPNDTITKSEILAILLKGIPFKIEDYPSYQFEQAPQFDSGNEWQYKIMTEALALDIIHPSAKKITFDCSQGCMSEFQNIFQFFPNRPATRAEVFGFAKEILYNFEGCKGCENTLGEVINDIIEYPSGSIFENNTLKFGSKVMVAGEGGTTEVHECSIWIEPMENFNKFFSNFVTFYGIQYQNNIQYFRVEQELAGNNTKVIIGQNYIYSLSDYSRNTGCLNKIKISHLIQSLDKVVLKIYYNFFNNEYIYGAYKMRSPAGVSLETFQSWYKDVTAVNFREDTMKDLGNNTYEFLVDLTENGKVDTYKVKSKVNVENFTIESISSVKQ